MPAFVTLAARRHEKEKVIWFLMNADNLTKFCGEGDVEANVSLHLHAKFKIVFGNLMLVAQYLPSALSEVATRSLLCYERLLSTRVSNVARISNVARASLQRALVGGRRFRPSVAVVSGRRVRPSILDGWNSGILFLQFLICLRLSSGCTFGDNCTSSDTSCPVLVWVSLMVALSVSRMCGSL